MIEEALFGGHLPRLFGRAAARIAPIHDGSGGFVIGAYVQAARLRRHGDVPQPVEAALVHNVSVAVFIRVEVERVGLTHARAHALHGGHIHAPGALAERGDEEYREEYARGHGAIAALIGAQTGGGNAVDTQAFHALLTPLSRATMPSRSSMMRPACSATD